MVALGLVCAAPVFAARDSEEKAALRKEIQELEQSIKDVKRELELNDGKKADDLTAFEAYAARHNKNMQRLAAERDSLRGDYQKLSATTSTLARQAQGVKDRQQEFDLLQKRYAQQLTQSCERVGDFLKTLPPQMGRKHLASVEFLRSEIASASVDNTEATERLFQILTTLQEESQTVDVFQGPSPLESMTGQVEFVRMGHAYIACVNEKATVGALWVPAQNAEGGAWQSLEDQGMLMELRKAAQIRQGKSIPEIARVPLRHPVVSDTIDVKGRVQ
jgi:hypothetical protein